MVQQESHQCFIEKSASCPPLPVSRWNVTKVHVKEKVLSAVERLGKSPSVKPYADDKPVVLVGPVIGLVTTTTARILLEINKAAMVEITLHREPADSNVHQFESSMASRRASGSFQPFGGSSSKASLYKPFLAETALVDARPESGRRRSDERISIGQSTIARKGSGSLKLWERSSSSLRRASSDKPFLTELGAASATAATAESGDMCSDESSSIAKDKHVVLTTSIARKGSGSFQLWKGSSSSRRSSRRASLYKPFLAEAAMVATTAGESITVGKEIQGMRACVFKFEGLVPGSRYSVKVKGCHEAVENSSFRTFSTEPLKNFRMASISCNSIFITKKTITPISDLWSHLSKLTAPGPEQIDLLIHLGDQIYGDGDRHLDAGAGKNRDKWSNRFKIALDILKDVPKDQWVSKQEEICEKYREVYRETWKHPYTAKCLATCSNLMIYDDHEIRDNWGDNQSDQGRECCDFFVAQCAWIVTLEYQRQLYEDVDFLNLEAIKKDYHFHVIGKVGLMFLDIRGSRTFHRVEEDKARYLGSKQWKDIKQALEVDGFFHRVQVLVVCSPAPLVFLVPSITSAAASTVDRLEDFKGHWSAHKSEQRDMIECLHNWKGYQKGREVIVLGGDVHCGGHSCILKSGETLFYQLTTSPIANMPLPKSAYYVMRFAEQMERIHEGIRFRHFNWTRARNYGLVHVKFEEEEEKTPQIITQLVKGKFMRPIRMGKRVSNLQKMGTYSVCNPMTPFALCKRRLISMVLKARQGPLLSRSSYTKEKHGEALCKNEK